MYRLIKEEDGQKEIISATGGQDRIHEWFKDYIFMHASNGEDYTHDDYQKCIDQGYERIGSYKISISEVSMMKEKEFISCGGGVCIHCHSDDVEPEELIMEDGYVSRNIECNICGESTKETYNLSGYAN